MKNKLTLTLCFFLLALACKKEPNIVNTTPGIADSLSLAEVKAYVDNLPQLATADTGHHFSLKSMTIPWDKAQSVRNGSGNYWLLSLEGRPVFQNFRQGYRKLVFQKDSLGRVCPRIWEIIPDGHYYQQKQRAATRDFTGRLFIYDASYRLTGGYVYSDGKVIGLIRPGKTGSQRLSTSSMSLIYADCQWYEYSYFDSEGVLTVYAERDCTYTLAYDGLGGDGSDYLGDGGGSAAGAPEPSNLPGESGAGVNASAYTKCFGTIAVNNTTQMRVTVYVQEPFPGTSFNIGPNSVGHTAIGLTETTGSSSITQTLGFYPDASGKDKMHAPGKIVDNSGLDYQVSISFQVDAVQFANLINYLNSPLPAYDITDFNCTGYVYAACQYAGINLPNPYTTIGLPYPDGTVSQAMTPAGLGNSIRNMQGQAGVNTNGGKVGISNGPCN